MSASTYREAIIDCDGNGCLQAGHGSPMETAADVRRALRGHGWATSVRNAETGKREDFCPAHKPQAGAK